MKKAKICTFEFSLVFFTTLHAMQTRSSDEKDVRLYVCLQLSVFLSVKRVTKRKKDLSRFLYHTKDHLAVFCEEEWLVGTSTST